MLVARSVLAGIDAAISLGIDYVGSIPKGRRTEDGTLPEKYNKIIELETTSYPVRTKKNVVDSDATLIFTYNKIGSGSALIKPSVLNLAGSRESSSQGIYNRVYEILMEVLKNE